MKRGPYKISLGKMTKDYIIGLPKRITSSGCWLYEESISKDGYGLVYNAQKGYQIPLHRLVAHLWHGLDLDDDRQLACHILECKNKNCFNHEHIYIGTHQTNTSDSVKVKTHFESSRTHCNKGHVLDGFTFSHSPKSKPHRYCKECLRESGRRNYRAKMNRRGNI